MRGEPQRKPLRERERDAERERERERESTKTAQRLGQGVLTLSVQLILWQAVWTEAIHCLCVWACVCFCVSS